MCLLVWYHQVHYLLIQLLSLMDVENFKETQLFKMTLNQKFDNFIL